MKVQCTHRNGDRIPDKVIALGNTPDSRFPIRFDAKYTVYAICLWQGVLHYLVINDHNRRPDWIPACFFNIVDGHIPDSWSCYYWREESPFGAEAIFGYEEIAKPDGIHYVNLIEREDDAMRVFDRRRQEIDDAAIDLQ